MNRIAAGLLAACVASPSLAATYTSLSDFIADPLAAGLVTEDFEAASRTGDVIGFSGGTITCAAASPVTYCPPTPSNPTGNTFFGLSLATDVANPGLAALTSRSGLNAPYFSSPDTIVFSFAAPISAFGIFVGALGDFGNAPTTLSGVLSTGETFTAFRDYVSTVPTNTNDFSAGLFFGITSVTPFTTIRFTASGIDGDGISFDDLTYAPARAGGGNDGGDTDPSVVPLPASALLLLAGIGGLAAAARRRGA